LLRFGLHVRRESCRVIKVYDGDSMTVTWQAAEGRDSFLYANCRLYGYDTPEMRGPQSEMAQECKRRVSEVLLGEYMLMSTFQSPNGLDKYGRPLITLEVDPYRTSQRVIEILRNYKDVADWALATLPGCKPYFGGTKQ
jgi:endonuclease YncB( thermonuclease family)